jgi:dienelactone hydrolase
MLGRPLTDYPATIPTNAQRIPLGKDELGSFERLWVEVAPGLFSYGLLFLPHGEGLHPYVSAFHGGIGTCELVSGFYPTGTANYNDLVPRIRKKIPAIVYVPQIMLWGEEMDTCPEEKSDNLTNENRMKQVGGSMAALEVYKIMRTVDWICANLPVDKDRMGVAGLSYGGFYTLLNAAIDTRYKAALSSCFFSDRYKHPWSDWVWFDSASKFLDPEIASMICPRALCIEVGEKDPLFKGADSIPLAASVAARYDAIGKADAFRFHMHTGGHEFCKQDENLDWFAEKLLK